MLGGACGHLALDVLPSRQVARVSDASCDVFGSMPVIFVIPTAIPTAMRSNGESCRSCRTKGSDAVGLVMGWIPEKADNHDA
jgi:hypothetical protein